MWTHLSLERIIFALGWSIEKERNTIFECVLWNCVIELYIGKVKRNSEFYNFWFFLYKLEVQNFKILFIFNSKN